MSAVTSSCHNECSHEQLPQWVQSRAAATMSAVTSRCHNECSHEQVPQWVQSTSSCRNECSHEAMITRFNSPQAFIGSTIREFSVGSALLVLEVVCCLYWHSFYQTDGSTHCWSTLDTPCQHYFNNKYCWFVQLLLICIYTLLVWHKFHLLFVPRLY